MGAQHKPVITAIRPAMGVPGGMISIACKGFEPGLPSEASVMVGDIPADILSASPDRVIAKLPDNRNALGISLRVRKKVSAVFPFSLATLLADGLHPVTSPVIAPDGTIITTVSGNRGEQTAHPLVRVTRGGEKIPFPCDIMNPTGLAFSPDGQLYISSRNDGTVLRYADYRELEVVADELGIPCGIAFDSEGNLYVGDRTGRIVQVDVGSGARTEFARLEPSVSAYHIAIDARDRLYVTAPTLSIRDSLFRIARSGEVEVVLHGFGRPQGMAFLPNGDLLITGGYQGDKGAFRFSPDTGEVEHSIAGPILVGVAASSYGTVLANSGSIFLLEPTGYNSSVS